LESIKLVSGQVVFCYYPFTSQTKSKHRPAFVVVNLNNDDFIACKISSQPVGASEKHTILIDDSDFESGGLGRQSKVVPTSIFTITKKVITSSVGVLKEEKRNEIIERIKDILDGKV